MAQAKTLTAKELKRVLGYIGRQKYAARDRAMFLVSHLSGMRVGEIASLTIGHVVDSTSAVCTEIRLAAAETKGKHPRTVFVNSKLQTELTAYLQTFDVTDSSRTLFPTQKNPLRGFTSNTMTQHFRNIYLAAGINGASSHSGRRTFATEISSKGVSIRVLMRALGHRNISTTIGYVDASDDMLRRAVELAPTY